MAISRLLRIKESQTARNRSEHLRHNLYYIMKEDKTENGLWINSNAGETPGEAYARMMYNKRNFGKTDGSQAFHYIISFPPDLDISNALAMQITDEFRQALFETCFPGRDAHPDEFYYVEALHTDTNHKHVHLTFDSVSRYTGLKYHSPAGDWKNRIQPILDELCKKYNVPTLQYDPEERVGKGRKSWEKDNRAKRLGLDPSDFDLLEDFELTEDEIEDFYKNEEADAEERVKKEKEKKESQQNSEPKTKGEYYSWYDIIRDDIDEAIRQSNSYKEFLNYLENEYYVVRDNNKNLTLTPPDRAEKDHAKARVRTSRLGKGYRKEEIIQRIEARKFEEDIQTRAENQKQFYVTYGNYKRMRMSIKIRVKYQPGWKMSPLQKRWWRMWNNTYFLHKPNRLTPEQRATQRKWATVIRSMENAMCYELDHQLDDLERLNDHYKKLQEEHAAIETNMNAAKNKYYNNQINRKCNKIRKLQKQYDENGDPSVMEKIWEIQNEIEKEMPYADALQKRDEMYQDFEVQKNALKNLEKDIKTATDIYTHYYNMNPPSGDFVKYESDATVWPDNNPDVPEETPQSRIYRHPNKNRHRITITKRRNRT